MSTGPVFISRHISRSRRKTKMSRREDEYAPIMGEPASPILSSSSSQEEYEEPALSPSSSQEQYDRYPEFLRQKREVVEQDYLTDIPRRQREADSMKESILKEGLLSPTRLQQLQASEANKTCNFTHKYFDEYFVNSRKLLDDIDSRLHVPDYAYLNLDVLLARLKDITHLVGASMILEDIARMSELYKEADMEGVNDAFEKIKIAVEELYNKMDPYLKMVDVVKRSEMAEFPPRHGSIGT